MLIVAISKNNIEIDLDLLCTESDLNPPLIIRLVIMIYVFYYYNF